MTATAALDRYNAGGAEARLAGRCIARRPGRDGAVVLGAGVVVVGGAFAPSAGSRQYPALIDSDGVVTLEVRDLPVEALTAARELEVRTARRRVDAAQSEIDAARRELRDAVGAAVDAGATKTDVARFLGVTRTTLYAYLNRPGPG